MWAIQIWINHIVQYMYKVVLLFTCSIRFKDGFKDAVMSVM
jgi:hypothetical protein